ncbi:hypothetical protein PF008_g27188 [Phytophthora fragariae]|uniref:Uncharacterized protein n=1 Tax=Phytophthora fragariae TaxID=53985 RepID=A0A6G0QEV4_9STRA|nr:hypothetical protein PF008_g27188 [Phytophthora fragariae]
MTATSVLCGACTLTGGEISLANGRVECTPAVHASRSSSVERCLRTCRSVRTYSFRR